MVCTVVRFSRTTVLFRQKRLDTAFGHLINTNSMSDFQVDRLLYIYTIRKRQEFKKYRGFMKRLIFLATLLTAPLHANSALNNSNLFSLPIPVESLPQGSGNNAGESQREEERAREQRVKDEKADDRAREQRMENQRADDRAAEQRRANQRADERAREQKK